MIPPPKILISRSVDEAAAFQQGLAQSLLQAGKPSDWAQVIGVPLIHTQPRPHALEALLQELPEPSAALWFTSQNGVRLFFEALPTDAIQQWTKRPCFVIGSATAKALIPWGIPLTWASDANSSEEALKQLAQSDFLQSVSELIWPTSDLSKAPRQTLSVPLRVCPVYETHPVASLTPEDEQQCHELDWTVLTSPSSVRGALAVGLLDPRRYKYRRLQVIAIGPTTLQSLEETVQSHESVVKRLSHCLLQSPKPNLEAVGKYCAQQLLAG